MTVNNYFRTTGESSEQNLKEDLVIECIQFWGQDFVYVERTKVADDILFGEDPSSEFKKWHTIEMYVESVDGFEGDNQFMSQFGLELRQSATLVVSRKRFKAVTSLEFPKEGDLIYFPMTNKLFEINYVNPEDPFYQLGKNHTYKLKIELFTLNHQDIDIDVSGVDELLDVHSVLTEGDIVRDEPITADNFDLEEISAESKNTSEDNIFGNY